METNVNYTAVGAFVIFLLTLIILAVIWISAGFSLNSYKIYKVYMDEPVSGVSLDSPVEFNGVDVGRVKKIKLNRDNPQYILLMLKLKSNTPVTRGTVARLSLRGITGQTFIGLIDKGTDKRPLLPATGEKYATIKTIPSIFVRVETALIKISESFEKMSGALTALLDKENQQLFKKILHNSAIASEQLTPLLRQAERSFRVLETKTLPNASSALTNASTAFTSFGTMSRDLSHVSHNLYEISKDIKQNPAVLIRGKAQRDLGPGER